MVQGSGEQTAGASTLSEANTPSSGRALAAPTDLTSAGSTTTQTPLGTLPAGHMNANASPPKGENQLSLARLSDQSHICTVDHP